MYIWLSHVACLVYLNKILYLAMDNITIAFESQEPDARLVMLLKFKLLNSELFIVVKILVF